MAGRGQHFIPKHFQLPFVVPNGKDQLWMYRRGASSPIPVARADAAKKRDFYSPPSEDGIPSLDDLITDYESYLRPKVDEIRNIKCGDRIPAQVISEIAVHLTFRTAYLRNVFIKTIDSLFENFSKAIQNHGGFLFSEQIPSSHGIPPKLEKILIDIIEDAEGFQSQTISSIALARIAYIMLLEKKNKLFDGEFESLDVSQNPLFGNPVSFVTNSHKQLLSKDLAPEFHVKALSKFNWRVVAHPETSAILPDCVCFGMDNKGNIQPLLLFDEKIETVVIPLSPSTLAIGQRGKSEFDIKNYNQLALKASFDFFLTDELKPELVIDFLEIGNQIRSNINSFSSDVIASKAKDLVEDNSLKKVSKVPNLIEDIQPKIDDEHTSISYTFMNGINSDVAESIAQNTNIIVTQLLSSQVTSTYLEKIVFVNNFTAALNDIDQGKDVSELGQTSLNNDENGIAVAKTIIKNGVHKSQIILKSVIGDLLLSNNENDQEFAIASISYTLISVEFLYIIKERFPEQFLFPIEDPVENFLYSYTGGIFENYYIYRIVNLKPETIEELESSLINLLEQSFQEIIHRRRLYRENGDLNDFFSFSVSFIKQILNTFSKLFASLDSLKKERQMSEKLEKILIKNNLFEWSIFFNEDLGKFYESLSSWSDFKQILFVNRHLERLLLAFGIIVDLGSDENVYLHVPIGSDSEYLQNLIENTTK